jgi:hypothetical protein
MQVLVIWLLEVLVYTILELLIMVVGHGIARLLLPLLSFRRIQIQPLCVVHPRGSTCSAIGGSAADASRSNERPRAASGFSSAFPPALRLFSSPGQRPDPLCASRLAVAVSSY